ncbi:MAG: hypothetical protein ACI9G1_004632 [Pirellulaceae bacterium]|jgi:hypothetical protein
MAKKKTSTTWDKDIVSFKRLAFWYGNFKDRKALEDYYESFSKQVGLPEWRKIRVYTNVVFGRNATLEDLIAEIRGSAYFGPQIEAELKRRVDAIAEP